MWPKDSGDPRRAAPKAAAGKGAGAKGRLTVVESLKAHVRSKGAFGMLAVGRYVRGCRYKIQRHTVQYKKNFRYSVVSL